MKNEKILSLAEKIEKIKENFAKKDIKYINWINGKINEIFGIEELFNMDYKNFLNFDLPTDFLKIITNVIDEEYDKIKLNEKLEDENEKE